MEPPEREGPSLQLPPSEDVSHSARQTPVNQLGGESQSWSSHDRHQQPWGHSFQPDLRDSNLSPSIPLLPVTPGEEHMFSEYSLFQQSGSDFAPLRAYPDISVASERLQFPPNDHTQASEYNSLSQHPLAQATVLSEEGMNSCCSLSQHSLSPGDGSRRMVTDHPSQITTRDDTEAWAKEARRMIVPMDNNGKSAEDETLFLSKEIPAQHLLKLLQKDVGMSSSSSAVSSGSSNTSVKIAVSFSNVSKPGIDQSTVRREGPPGQASLSPQQVQQPDRRTLSEVCNISVGPRGTRPDDSSEALHRELLFEVERRSSQDVESESQTLGPLPRLPCHTPYPTEGKPRANVDGVPWTGPFSTGLVQRHGDQDFWSPGNQTGIDGSYLGFLPHSQSTPAVFKKPDESSAKANVGQPSPVESSKARSCESDVGPSSQALHHPVPPNQCHEEATSAKVKSLPSLNYMEKVDAWRANQSSGKTSLFDSLALQGFSGVSPKKKAYEAVSESLNRILTQQVRSLQQPPVSSAASQNITQSSTTVPSGPSSKRGEAVGSSPSDRDANATAPSASTFGQSQSHSSLSTVVMSAKKDQQKEERPQPGTSNQTPQLASLGHFSDVSTDRDVTLSGSQDSCNSEVKPGASIGTSSVSLEVDNYAPYWSSKPSTPAPPPHRDFNIEDRIPLYLHNLGIDQSPSTILTPFAPRGPIREPEFSPTDLCTIKGSIGTPSKSTQPSEGGSPHKGEFSRSSVLSADSSVSLPFSVDSLSSAVSVPERPMRPSPQSDTEDVQSERRLASSSLLDEDSYPSTLQTALHQQRDSSRTSSQNTIRSEERLGPDLLAGTGSTHGDRDGDFSLESSCRTAQSADTSLVSSSALLEIRKLLSQAENVVSAGSSAASSASPAAARLRSDEDIFLSLKKKSSRVQDSSSFSSSSSTAADPRGRPSLLWARSSSDSMLSSEKLRGSSIGRESTTSLGQVNYPYRRPQDGAAAGAGSSLVQSARRAEPEGCSAAPPDNTAPAQPAVITPAPAPTPQPATSTPTDVLLVAEEDRPVSEEAPALQSSSPSPAPDDADQGAVSDDSSQSSLAVRVAKLLQTESTATMVSSTASNTDQEESKAREWIRQKVSGQQCEPLELDKEDRMRIEEIKRELLLKNPMLGQGSTDTESSTASSLRVRRGRDDVALRDADRTSSQQPQQSIISGPSDLGVQPHSVQPHVAPRFSADLEIRVREIAAREGVLLPRANPHAITSITISTRRRSSSTSASASPAAPLSPAPEPLQLMELCTVTQPQADRQLHSTTVSVGGQTATDAECVFEPSSRNGTRLSAPVALERQDAVGGQSEEPPAGSGGVDDTAHSVRADDRGFIPVGSVSDGTLEAAPGPPARTTHVSRVRLTLSPKPADHSPNSLLLSSHPDAVSGLQSKDFVPLRHSSSAGSSPDEGVGLSSPPEWLDHREPPRQQERRETSGLFKATQTLAPGHRAAATTRPSSTESPAVPVLLPYKPRGSEELFYIPHTEADLSCTERSETSMESTHTGSDDAVPPRFSSDVLGHQDPGLDRGVTIRHTEGIYSKRLNAAGMQPPGMQPPGHREAESRTSQDETPAPKSTSQESVAFTARASLLSDREASHRDQGTSPVQILSPDPSELRDRPGLLQQSLHQLDLSAAPQAAAPQDQDQGLHPAAPQPGGSSRHLDQLWQKFCERWSPEESRSASEREASLLERLERLSRLVHSSRSMSEREQSVEVHGPEPQHSSLPVDQDSFASSSCQTPASAPADRDETETVTSASSASGSMSTVDTARLVRAFGAHRVQHLKSGSGLRKLYHTIDKQKSREEQRRKKTPSVTLTEATGTDDSTVTADSASSSSTYSVPSLHGPSRTLAAPRTVRMVSKGIQAGDLELVTNGTRRHTRDVGVTFPSPDESRTSRHISSSSSSLERGRGARRSPAKPQRENKRRATKGIPEGVSWFISAEELRSEARKENQPEEEEREWRPSTAWFEPYSRVQPWREREREPLRQRHDGNTEPGLTLRPEPEPETRTKPEASARSRVSLQEALELRRPQFISQSLRRVERLLLQAEERRLQENLSREREELFSRPGGAGRLPRPAGTALLRRAVPRKEMIQRSKQIYDTLPEVQRRREEERRKAEYRSYRLNAQLYNKRITSRVLGRRRAAWQ